MITDPRKLPKEKDVTFIDAGPHQISVAKITPENVEYFTEIAIAMYANQPCRICGIMLTDHDVSVRAGHSADRSTSLAHKDCWERSPRSDGLPNEDWVYQ